jgi:hypothetical protein
MWERRTVAKGVSTRLIADTAPHRDQFEIAEENAILSRSATAPSRAQISANYLKLLGVVRTLCGSGATLIA